MLFLGVVKKGFSRSGKGFLIAVLMFWRKFKDTLHKFRRIIGLITANILDSKIFWITIFPHTSFRINFPTIFRDFWLGFLTLDIGHNLRIFLLCITSLWWSCPPPLLLYKSTTVQIIHGYMWMGWLRWVYHWWPLQKNIPWWFNSPHIKWSTTTSSCCCQTSLIRQYEFLPYSLIFMSLYFLGLSFVIVPMLLLYISWYSGYKDNHRMVIMANVSL